MLSPSTSSFVVFTASLIMTHAVCAFAPVEADPGRVRSVEADRWAEDADRPFFWDGAASEAYRWRAGLHYFQGTTSDFGEVLTGQGDLISQNGVRASLGYVFIKQLWGYPIEVIGEGGLMWHNEQGAQSDVWQSTLAFKIAWTKFPWDEHLRTRLAAAEGFSYVSHIPQTEKLNRGSNTSKHFLNYLEASLAFNCGDIFRILSFSHEETPELDRSWLMISVPHRSGAWGLYGRDNDGEAIKGGSSYLALGIEYEF